MSTSVSLNAVTYVIPAIGESAWGTQVSSYLIALSTGVLQKAGGSFTLTADADFGTGFGLKSIYYKSRGTVATAGILRLANNESIGWRNAANGADYLLKVNASNGLEFNGNAILYGAAATLTASKVLVSDASGLITVASTTPTQVNYLSAATGTTGTTSTNIVFSTSPTLVTPVLGVATATSINKMAITAPASSSTLAIADGKTFTVSNILTLTGTDSTSFAFPSGSSTVMTLSSADTITGVKTFGDGKLVLSGASSGASTLKAPAVASTFVHTLPAATDTLVGLTFQQTATNKLLSDSTVKFANVSDATKLMVISLGGATTAKTMTLISSHTNDRSITLPDATDTLMGKATSDIMTNKTATAMAVTGGSYIDMLTQAAVRFNDDSGGEYVALKAPTGVTTHTLLLPATQGSASTTLTNDGSGNLSWAAAASATLNQFNTDIGNASNVRTATNTSLLGDIKATTTSQTYAVTSAAPGVFTISGHGFLTGDKVYVTVTQNGFTANTTYYVTKIDANTFKLATTLANAVASTNITSSGTTAGTMVGGGYVLTSGTKATVTNDSATAGYVGEYISSSVTAVSLTGGAYATCGSITLTPGDWMVVASCTVHSAALQTYVGGAIADTTGNSTSGSTAGESRLIFVGNNATQDVSFSMPAFRVSLASSAVRYFNVLSVVTTTVDNACIRAWRVR